MQCDQLEPSGEICVEKSFAKLPLEWICIEMIEFSLWEFAKQWYMRSNLYNVGYKTICQATAVQYLTVGQFIFKSQTSVFKHNIK